MGRGAFLATTFNIADTLAARPETQLGHVVQQRVKHAAAVSQIVSVRVEIALEQVPPETGINQVFVAVVSACGERAEVIHGSFSARVGFRQAAVAATPAVSLLYCVVFRVGHWLTLDAQLFSRVGAESCLQLDNPLLQLPPSLLKLFAS